MWWQQQHVDTKINKQLECYEYFHIPLSILALKTLTAQKCSAVKTLIVLERPKVHALMLENCFQMVSQCLLWAPHYMEM